MKRKNPQDATLRNINALKNRMEEFTVSLREQREKTFQNSINLDYVMQLARRITAVEHLVSKQYHEKNIKSRRRSQ